MGGDCAMRLFDQTTFPHRMNVHILVFENEELMECPFIA